MLIQGLPAFGAEGAAEAAESSATVGTLFVHPQFLAQILNANPWLLGHLQGR
jgi:hypothetical protein